MNSQEKVWKVGVWVGVILAIFLLALTIKEFKSIAYVGKDTPVYNNISVNGKGEAMAIPNIATFSFSVTENAKTVADAQTKATDKVNAALKALRDAGIEDKDIQTTSYSINPHYEYQNGICTVNYCNPGKSILTGYDVSQSVSVKVRELAKAGSLFTTIGLLDVQNVNSLSFSTEDIETVKAEARAKAIADAQAKAKVLAKQLGVRIVKITSFYDSSDQPSYYGREGMGGDMMSSIKVQSANGAPEIPAGEQKVVSSVTITYEIK